MAMPPVNAGTHFGGHAANDNRARSPSMGSSVDYSSDSDDAGARLSSASAEGSLDFKFPGRLNLAKAKGTNKAVTIFQLGKKPSGDVFEGSLSPLGNDQVSMKLPETQVVTSPAKDVVDLDKARELSVRFHEEMALLSPVKTSNDRRMARSVTTGGPMGVNSQPPAFLRNQLSYTSVRHQNREIDAQGLYPSTACVFVANLPEPKDDCALEAAVTRVFSRYGTVFVKIRRDNKHMPFAFCQFTKNEDAKAAMEQGKGAMIFGRPCRTEMVKANCSFIVWKRRGGDITVDEVRELLEPFGELTKCEPLDDEVRHSIRIRSAVHVEFSNFDPSRDLGSGVRQFGEYQIDPFDPKKKLWAARPDADKEYLKQYDADRRTVYVTGLPLDVDDAELTDFFSEVGQVSKVHIVKRPGYDGVIYRAFAFVEYARGDMPDKAVDRFRNDVMRGHKLKVERKITANPKTPAAFEGSEQSPAVIAYGTHITPASAPPTQGFMMYPGVGHQMLTPGYINTPMGPHGTVFGYNGMPVTPSPVPTGYAPYMGAYWPGVPSSQDRTAGMPHGLYGSPSIVGGAMVPGPAGPNYTPVHYGANFGEDVGNDKKFSA